MAQTHLVIPDPHAHYKYNNDRALWAGELIKDVKPDIVICLGDSADMPSLSGYDKGKKCFQGRTYRADIEAHLDFQEKLWGVVKSAKKKLPRRIFLLGNHEERIGRAIEMQPELEGAIGYDDLELDEYYDEVVGYSGSSPGSISVDGIIYSHFLLTGISGRPIGGEHTGYSLLVKQFNSCVVGHSHIFDHCIRTRADGRAIHGLSAGCYFDYDADWAGEANKLYWRGLVLLKGVDDGEFDLETIKMSRLKKEYSK